MQGGLCVMEERIKEYSNEDITIVWKANLCIHAGECVKRLPKVYDPNAKPWIKIENADTKSLKDQVAACPSGALTYYSNKEDRKVISPSKVSVKVTSNGPLILKGAIILEKKDGDLEEKENVALCRCGASANKPYCDGSHTKVEFKDE